MKISVIIPFYNRSSSIRRAAMSVINQDIYSFRDDVNIEILIVDDGSDPSERLILNNLCAELKNVKLLGYDSNKGANYARNFGLFHAENSDFIVFLDSDECLKINFFSCLYPKLVKNCEWLCTGFEVVSRFGRRNVFIKDIIIPDIPAFILKDGGHLKTSCMVFSKDCLLTVRWDEELRRFQDIAFVLQLYLAGHKVNYVPISLVDCYKDEPNRISANGGSRAFLGFLQKFENKIDSSLLCIYRMQRLPSLLMQEGEYMQSLRELVTSKKSGCQVGFGFRLRAVLHLAVNFTFTVLKKVIEVLV